ncbi:MAG: nucleoside monophosphate kinase [Tepidisphaeraceae bacterium]
MKVQAANDRAAWLQGPPATCPALPHRPTRAWRLVLLGAPGVGKGTQAELLCGKLGACHLSTGDVFRAAAGHCNCHQTPAMTAAIVHMRAGELEGIALDAVIDYELPLANIVDRLSGRRICEKCKAVFHVTQRPSFAPGVCDQCGGHLYQREDDRPEAVQVRMKTYEQATKPLIDFYRGMGTLVSIPANGTPDEIFARSLTALKAE